ncbi:MAG TPA: response regulator [Candidatus Acidoferrales bacterium]|jgi:DNA-binding response OmpR family regulator|nr:response regulator [Candidatus Acidoferrales bacterium]
MEQDRRALVVDDDPAVRELIDSVLGSTGIDVLTLERGAEAIELLRTEKFAALLFDLRMPSPNGIDLTRQARGSGFNQRTPIILLSDDQSPKACSEGFVAGASFFFYKPIDKGHLMSLARAMGGAIENEKRRFRRVPLRSNVTLTYDHVDVRAETIDVSLDGMLVAAHQSLPAGSVVHVALQLAPGHKPILGSGVIVRALPGNRLGIQLSGLPIGEQERLQEFLLPLILQEKPEVATSGR